MRHLETGVYNDFEKTIRWHGTLVSVSEGNGSVPVSTYPSLSIERRQFGPDVHDVEVDEAAADFAAMVLQRADDLLSQTRALARRIHREHSEIGALALRFDIDAARQARLILGHQEAAGFETVAHSLQIDAVLFDKKLLHQECAIDQGGDLFRLVRLSDSEIHDLFIMP